VETLIHLLGPLHPAVIHFPIACSLLAFGALLAQWFFKEKWLSYAAASLWAITFLSAIAAFLSGHSLALHFGIVPEWSWIPPEAALKGQLQEHALYGTFSLLFSIATLTAAWNIWNKKPWPLKWNLALGLLLAVGFSLTGYEGGEMVYGFYSGPKAADASASSTNDLLDQCKDFRKTLVKMNTRSWNSRTHGHRWVNTYVSKDAVKAYENSNPLPIGSWVIKESFEDENGGPSRTAGPLYVMKKGAVAEASRTSGWQFAVSWEKPVPNNPEKIKLPVKWLPGDAHLNSCAKCHSRFKDKDYLGGIPEGFEKP
jgi:uncharacterized membrane protein